MQPHKTESTRLSKLSKDGKWRSFAKVSNLLQYVSTGKYYARLRINGKLIWHCLDTDVWSDAKLRLADYVKEQRLSGSGGEYPLFSECVSSYRKSVEKDVSMKERSQEYRFFCIGKIQETWPELWQLRINEITPQMCLDWSAKLCKEIAAQYFNNTIGTLKLIIQTGIDAMAESGKSPIRNPAAVIKRVKIPPKALKLPERDHFRQIIELIRKTASGWNHRSADLVEFLAYSGMRLNTEAYFVTWEDVDWQRKEIIVRGDPKTHTKNWEVRRIPMIEDMTKLLTAMREELEGDPKGKILQVAKCAKSLKSACGKLGIPRITHHDLRHLFATRCIESGVDIPTVSRWLGHKDGGALAMKVYGHLRNEHSQAMAEKVHF